MPKALRVLVLGSGFAGQGHAEAFRNAGVEIIGMISRTLSVTQQVAKEMNIPYATTDWKTALTQLQPDIVAVGTPGGSCPSGLWRGLGGDQRRDQEGAFPRGVAAPQ